MREKRLELREDDSSDGQPKRIFMSENPQKNLRFLGWCFAAGGLVATLIYAGIVHWSIWSMMKPE